MSKPLTARQIQQLHPHDLEAMSAAELKANISILNSVANKRIRRLQEHGIKTIVGDTKQQSSIENLHFSNKGLTGDKGELIGELQKVKRFLQKESTTQRGLKRIKARFEKNVGKKLTQTEFENINQAWYNVIDKVESWYGIANSDIKQYVAQHLAAGDSEQKILQKIVEEYGVPYDDEIADEQADFFSQFEEDYT